MSNFFRVSMLTLGSMLLLAGLSSCGSGTNNDQGASFTNTGYYVRSDGGDDLVGSSGTFVVVNTDYAGQHTGYPTPVVLVFMGFQNNLTDQFLRVERIECDYDISGADADLVIPSDSNPVTLHLGAIGTSPDADEGIEGGFSTGESEFLILSPDMLSFLVVNSSRLPELPYRMTAVCRAVAVSQAGDVYFSNYASYLMQMTDNPEYTDGRFDDNREDDELNDGTYPGFQTGNDSPESGGDPTPDPEDIAEADCGASVASSDSFL